MSGASLDLRDAVFAHRDWAISYTLAVKAGEFIGVIGPSGAGKSTLLSLIAGFEQQQSGSIFIEGRNVAELAPQDRPVTMVFQDHNTFAHLDVFTNVALGLAPDLRLSGDDRKRVTSAIERVRLGGMEQRKPGELSGGEHQRVALARALVRDRPILLLDEPFTALGPALRADMLRLIGDLHTERKMTVVMVSHDPGDVKALAGRIAFIDNGRVEAFLPSGQLFASTDLPALAAYLGPTV